MITEEAETETKDSPSHRPPDLERHEPPDGPPGTPKRRWIWVVLAILAAIVLIYLWVGRSAANAAAQKAAAAAAVRAIPVVVGTAHRGDMPVYVTGLGSVNANYTVTVRSRVDGQLMKIRFTEGQLVKAGDVLAELDPRPFQVQLLQAEGQQAKDEAAYKNAQIDLQRYEVLIKQDAIPRQQLDAQGALVNQDEATLKSDLAAIESAKLNLTYSRIEAPITGQIGLRLVDPGNIVHTTDANGLLVITQLQPIIVLFTIPADSLPPLLREMRAGHTLAVDAFDRDLHNKLATGTLLALDNQIDQTTGTVRLKAIFPNKDNALFPNQFVNARLLVTTLNGVVLVPTAAIQRSPTSNFLYVVKPDKTVEARNIEVQLTAGDDTAVRSGIAAGEVVVTDGVDKLQPGMKVQVGSPTSGQAGAARGGTGGTGKKAQS
jgi:multidrug efflux system membrane fusion protein